MSSEDNNSFLSVWYEHKDRAIKALDQLDEVHSTMKILVEHSSHLQKLDALTDIKDNLISFAVGRDQIPTKIVETMLKQVEKSNKFASVVLGAVILGLLAIVIFLLTGEHLGWVHKLFSAGAS